MAGGVSVTVGGEALADVANRVARISVSRGRQDELNRTGTGSCTISLNYTSGTISDFIGEEVTVQVSNPLGGSETVFVGKVAEMDYGFHPSQVLTTVDLTALDALDHFAGIELAPGLYGVVPLPAGVLAGNIFYEQAIPQDRIRQAVLEADFTGATEIFTGNVQVRDTIYSPRTSLLTVIHDAADAEFPGVANVYVQRNGTFTFHGRLARFNPGDPQYHITTFKAGDGQACAGDTARAQLRGLRMGSSERRIINAALATPEDIAEADIPGQIVADATSIAAYGTRAWSAENLLTFFDDLNNLTANAAVKQFAQYYVDNYSSPVPIVEEVTLRSISTIHPNASATWALMLTGDISDLINLQVGDSPGTSVSGDYFIESVALDIVPLNESFADVTARFGLSPRAFWNTSF